MKEDVLGGDFYSTMHQYLWDVSNLAKETEPNSLMLSSSIFLAPYLLKSQP